VLHPRAGGEDDAPTPLTQPQAGGCIDPIDPEALVESSDLTQGTDPPYRSCLKVLLRGRQAIDLVGGVGQVTAGITDDFDANNASAVMSLCDLQESVDDLRSDGGVLVQGEQPGCAIQLREGQALVQASRDPSVVTVANDHRSFSVHLGEQSVRCRRGCVIGHQGLNPGQVKVREQCPQSRPIRTVGRDDGHHAGHPCTVARLFVNRRDDHCQWGVAQFWIPAHFRPSSRSS